MQPSQVAIQLSELCSSHNDRDRLDRFISLLGISAMLLLTSIGAAEKATALSPPRQGDHAREADCPSAVLVQRVKSRVTTEGYLSHSRGGYLGRPRQPPAGA
jgi:hypothetical protein